MTEQQMVNHVQEAMMYIISFYAFVILICCLMAYVLILMDKYGHKWKYFKKKRKTTLTGYIRKDWVLEKRGIGICHPVVWLQGGAESRTKVRITIKEI